MQEESIGRRIRHLRETTGTSQKELAGKLYVSRKTVSSWECGRTAPNHDMIVRLSTIFHTSPNYLLMGRSRL